MIILPEEKTGVTPYLFVVNDTIFSKQQSFGPKNKTTE